MLILVLLLGWLAPPARALTVDGVTLPDTYPVDGQNLVLNGSGVRTLTIFRIRAYVAALYLLRPSHDAQQIMASSEPKVILLKFLHSASKARVERQYRAGEETNCEGGGCRKSDEADFERLVASAPAVERGDSFTYIFTASGVRVLVNDQLSNNFANRDLASRLLAGFIGAHPPTQELRSELLGLPGG